MKIFCVENNLLSLQNLAEPEFYIKPETALLRNNQSFFYPEYTQNVVCSVSLVVRLSRIGRCISAKFANRYYDEIGVGINFTAADVLQYLHQNNLPADRARSFDFSSAVSPDFIKVEDFTDLQNINFNLNINGKTEQESNSAQMLFGIEKIVAYISQFVSFKIGDLIFVNPVVNSSKISIGDTLQAFINNKKLLDFAVE